MDARQVDSWHLAASLTTLSPPRSLGPSLVWAPKKRAHRLHYMDMVSCGLPAALPARSCTSSSIMLMPPPPTPLACQNWALRFLLPADPCPGSPCSQSLSPGPPLPHSELFLRKASPGHIQPGRPPLLITQQFCFLDRLGGYLDYLAGLSSLCPFSDS